MCIRDSSHNEQVTLLAYSPLGAGMLTGKYTGGAVPEGSRMSFEPDMFGRRSDRAISIAQMYADIAERYGLHPVHMALAFVCQRPYPTSPIFGARTVDQLQVILDGKDVILSDEVLTEIAETHRANPMPY